jgi:streptomycin 6-kinase
VNFPAIRGEVDIPAKLLAFADRSDAWSAWLDRLPGLARGILDEWGLSVDGPAMHGECALVVPVRDQDGTAAVLKVGWPHEEADEEHLALRLWAGNGAVRLMRADPHRSAMLMERLDTTDLTTVPIDEAVEVVTGLYPRLHVPASPQFRTLSSLCDRWNERMCALPKTAGLPPRYVDRAAGLLRDLAADPQTDGRLIHTDLHFFNVLRGDREPWLVIDPKPLSGDPVYELSPLLWNRWEEIVDSGSARNAIRNRFFSIVDAAGFDEQRAKDWVVVRMMVNIMWEIEDPSPPSDNKSWVTDMLTIAKAMDD